MKERHTLRRNFATACWVWVRQGIATDPIIGFARMSDNTWLIASRRVIVVIFLPESDRLLHETVRIQKMGLQDKIQHALAQYKTTIPSENDGVTFCSLKCYINIPFLAELHRALEAQACIVTVFFSYVSRMNFRNVGGSVAPVATVLGLTLATA